MSSKRHTPSVLTASSSSHDSKDARRRRRTSSGKTSSNRHRLDINISPEITLEQPTPTRVTGPWTALEQEDKAESSDNSASKNTALLKYPSNPHSDSVSSSASASSADSDSDSPSIDYPGQEPTRILSSLPTTTQIHPLVASLRSSHSRSPNRTPQSSTPPYLASLGPPFFNRPPTPLLTSPSLTSLFRPGFSAPTSRPTTPDESETDSFINQSTNSLPGTITPDNSTAHLLNTAQAAQPLPRTNPKVPTYEYYGFALYLTSSVAFLGYILWSYLPSTVLHWLGIYYYPDRWWSLAIPAWIVVAVMFMYVALASYNSEILTLPLGDLRSMVDEVGVVAIVDQDGNLVGKGRRDDIGTRKEDWRWKDAWSHGTDAVLDVPIGGVCEVLYSDG